MTEHALRSAGGGRAQRPTATPAALALHRDLAAEDLGQARHWIRPPPDARGRAECRPWRFDFDSGGGKWTSA
jgi:hypothetical protein